MQNVVVALLHLMGHSFVARHGAVMCACRAPLATEKTDPAHQLSSHALPHLSCGCEDVCMGINYLKISLHAVMLRDSSVAILNC